MFKINSDHIHTLKIRLIMIVFLAMVSCIHNYEPVIKSITADPNPVGSEGIVSLTCNASDDDESSYGGQNCSVPNNNSGQNNSVQNQL